MRVTLSRSLALCAIRGRDSHPDETPPRRPQEESRKHTTGLLLTWQDGSGGAAAVKRGPLSDPQPSAQVQRAVRWRAPKSAAPTAGRELYRDRYVETPLGAVGGQAALEGGADSLLGLI